jgi:3-oxoacyl-[acyl-carrier-protein] synthase-1
MGIKITAYEALCNLGLNIDEIFNRALNGEDGHFVMEKKIIEGYTFRLGKVNYDKADIENSNFNIRCNNLIKYVLNLLKDKITNAIETYSKDEIAVVVATTNSGVEEYEISGNKFHSQLGNPALFVKDYLDLNSLAVTVSTACSSGIKAFSLARNYLNTGIAKAVLVIGVDTIAKVPLYGFSSLEILTPQKTNPFSKNYTGINIGEACTCFIVEKGLQKEGIEILGIGENTDTYHATTPDPEAKEVKKAIYKALDDAGINKNEIDYINLHGTGTLANDTMESEAINSVFGVNVPVSSTKPLTGHCLGAAASIETVLCCHLLNNFNGKLLPHINDNEYNNELKPVKLVKLTDDYKKCDICMSNSFGFGGTNAIIILGKKND